MAGAYENAIAEKSRLQLQKSVIDNRISEIDTFLRLHAEFEKQPERTTSSEVAAPEGLDAVLDVSARPDQKQNGVTQKEFNEHLLNILVEANRPLPSKEIRAAFRHRAIPIGGLFPEKNFSSKMWQATKDGGFVRIESSGFIWIKGESYPEAGYIAERDDPSLSLNSNNGKVG